MIAKGSRVQYKKSFLQSISAYMGNMPRAKGVVKEIKNYGELKIAVIEWDLPEVPEKVNVANLQELK